MHSLLFVIHLSYLKIIKGGLRMKKILLGLFSFLFVSFLLFNGENVYADGSEDPSLVMIAPDLDLSTVSEEDMAILKSQGWDFTGEVPVLVQTEEELGFEIAESVAGTTVNLSDLFERMDEGDNNTQESYNTGFGLFSLPSMEVGGSGMYVPIFSAPPHGSKVYRNGDLVHCNRFNGPNSDNKHYSKSAASLAKSLKNFYKSDCYYGVARGICSEINDVCNTSTRYHRAWCSWQIGHKLTYHKH